MCTWTILCHSRLLLREHDLTCLREIKHLRKGKNVKEAVMLHFGFYDENGGFRISAEDRNYMQTCYAVVSTCAFGGGDGLCQPIGMVEDSLSKESGGIRVSEGSMIGKWRIVLVRNLPFSDQRLNGKISKMLVDSKSQFPRDPMGVLEALLWRTNSVFSISEHGRGNIYEEVIGFIKKHKATPEEVDTQLKQYRKDKHPDHKKFRGKKGTFLIMTRSPG